MSYNMANRAVYDIKQLSSHLNEKVGVNIKSIRHSLGLSQSEMAAALDITYQQMQKYESGQNRIACSSLLILSRTFNIPISAFFEGIDYRTEAKQRNI